MTLGQLHFVYICSSLLSKIAEHFLQMQSTVCAAFADTDTSFLERLLSDWSLLPWFLALFLFFGFVQPLITDSEFKPAISEDDKLPQSFECKVDAHWFKTFLTSQARPYISVRKWLKICKCQRTTTPPTLEDRVCWQTNCEFVHIVISVLSGNSLSVV